ncbi:SNCAP protein, partial [Polypterus senegalus]
MIGDWYDARIVTDVAFIPVSGTNWSCGMLALNNSGLKPTGIADVYSKFRPVKRVSPLKHQPEDTELETDSKEQDQKVDSHKDDPSEKLYQSCSTCPSEGLGFKSKDGGCGLLFGELEHYDLDMDEILDVPYIKSNQQLSSLSKVAGEKRTVGVSSNDKGHSNKTCSVISSENLPASMTQFCVLAPVRGSELRKAQAIVADQHRHTAGGLELPQSLLGCTSLLDADAQAKNFSNRTFADPLGHKADKTMPNCQPRSFQVQNSLVDGKLDENSNRTRTNLGEKSEDAKKVKSILNIVREGQISLLPHLAADNLEKIHDENGNNLLHISALQGHTDCLQHLTSLMGEDCLNERNNEQLTPAGLSIRNGHLECVRWMVSETEAIAELSCTRDHPSLIHYAASYGQTLVEYGANVTIQNQQGEKPSQCAERQGHVTCSRYLVVVETCMSLASQVVKLTKQLKDSPLSPSATRPQVPFSPEQNAPESGNSALPRSCISSLVNRRLIKQKEEDADKILRQLLGKEIVDNVCTQEKLSLEFQDRQKEGAGAGPRILRRMPAEKRELKIARLRQIMQRSLSESDTDNYNSEEQKNTPAKRADKPRPQPIVENVESAENLHLMIRKHTTNSGKRYAFATGLSKSMDGQSPSPTSESSDPDFELLYQSGSLPRTCATGEVPPSDGQKSTTSPKSALKSPSSKRRTSQNLKLRVTFEEPVVHIEQTEGDSNSNKNKESEKNASRTSGSESGDSWKRPFGTFRSIMESLSGNQNNNNNNNNNHSNNNYQAANIMKTSASGLLAHHIGRKVTDSKANQITPLKLKNKTVSAV